MIDRRDPTSTSPVGPRSATTELAISGSGRPRAGWLHGHGDHTGRLLAPTRRSADWAHTHPRQADALLAGGLALVGVLLLLVSDVSGSEREPDALGFALIVVGNAALLLRRTHPVWALGLALAATMPFWVLDYRATMDVTMLVALYSAAAHEPSRTRGLAASASAVGVMLAVAAAGVVSSEEDLTAAALAGIAFTAIIAVALGDNMRHRRAYLAELWARAERAETDREREAQRAVRAERERIARELHDVVAHSVSLMVVQAGAARRTLGRDPAAAKAALENIEGTGRASLDELRRVLGVLRNGEGGASLVPQPTLDEFANLVRQCAEAGLVVTVERTGHERSLGAGRELTVFRIVQEALTNTLKHAGPTSAEVVLDYGPEVLHIEVTDSGRGAAARDTNGAEHGLVGMRERVELYDGSLTAGPRRGGGFRVSVELPIPTVAPSGLPT